MVNGTVQEVQSWPTPLKRIVALGMLFALIAAVAVVGWQHTNQVSSCLQTRLSYAQTRLVDLEKAQQQAVRERDAMTTERVDQAIQHYLDAVKAQPVASC